MLIHGPDACSTHAASTATSSLGDWRHEITVRQGRATRLFQRSFPHTFACQPTSQRNRPVERGLECYGREAFLRIAFSEALLHLTGQRRATRLIQRSFDLLRRLPERRFAQCSSVRSFRRRLRLMFRSVRTAILHPDGAYCSGMQLCYRLAPLRLLACGCQRFLRLWCVLYSGQ